LSAGPLLRAATIADRIEVVNQRRFAVEDRTTNPDAVSSTHLAEGRLEPRRVDAIAVVERSWEWARKHAAEKSYP